MKTYLKRLNGKSYLNQHIHQTLPRLIIPCFDRWYMAWLSSILIQIKMPKMGRLVVRLKGRFVFATMSSDSAKKMGEKEVMNRQDFKWYVSHKFLKKNSALFMKNQGKLIQDPNLFLTLIYTCNTSAMSLCWEKVFLQHRYIYVMRRLCHCVERKYICDADVYM